MTRIHLVQVGSVPRALLEHIGRRIEDVLRCQVMGPLLSLDPGFAFDRRRRQYWSTPILKHLAAMGPSTADRMLGVTEVDLFIPILTFVFGEALLNRPPALISLHRLSPVFYGLPADPQRTIQRACTEAVHELGHTFGLVHCDDYACAMHASHNADEIDLKGPDICDDCTTYLESDITSVPHPDGEN